MKRSQKYFRRQQEALGKVNGHIEEMYASHIVVKSFNGEADSIARFDELNDGLYESAWKSQFLSGLIMPIMTLLGNINYVAISIIGGDFVVAGRVPISDIQAILQYIRSFNQPITQLASISNILQQTVAASERVFEFLEQPEEFDETVDTDIGIMELAGGVTFKGVTFGYKPAEPVINSFSANIAPGRKIAIVGPTGAGKTTIVKLLMRFYEIEDGGIFIDGHNIKDFSRHDLRSMFGMVLQDTWLYNASIMDNIRFGTPDAADEDVIRAAKSACVHNHVRTLPDGYGMVMNEESTNISAGQKQLLTIARAILSDPRILILDEATSSVDTKTEMDIQKAMDNLMKGRTSFIIAHRLSTIRDADLILVMNKGDIIEQGSHEALMKKGGFYAELYASQFDTAESV
jgi:ATP-binding cassette subfamily B protein